MIKSIETYYKGYLCRSRTEARWMVAFDRSGIEYEYEPEGFDLGKPGKYLPDLYLILKSVLFISIEPVAIIILSLIHI